MLKRMLLLAAACAGSFLTAEIFRVAPGDGSFGAAVKKMKPGDTILLAPGEYRERLKLVSDAKQTVQGLTFKAAIPGSVVFRGDVPAPKFVPAGVGVWKASFPTPPECVFERDTLTRYTYCGTRSGLERECGAWTYDAKSKTLYIRTTASDDPARHCLTVGVTPEHGLNIYCKDAKSGPRNVRFEGFAVTGFYSRARFSDQRLPSSQQKVPWGLVVSKPWDNVVIRDVTAFLNGLGVGFTAGSRNSVIENCRAWGNGNPFNHSGDGVGIYDSNTDCIVRNNIGADNLGNDVFLYSGTFGSGSKFENNRAYGVIRCKGQKEKGFQVRNCVAAVFSHLLLPAHLSNCFAFGYVDGGEGLTKNNLFPRYEKGIVPDEIFADPENFDCRPMSGVPAEFARRAPGAPSEKLFFVSARGNDAADGRSVKTAFATLKRAQKALVPGAELYIVGPIEGDLVLKGVKNVAIRGRGRFAAFIKGKIVVENCDNVKLERLSPESIAVRKGNGLAVTQCYGKFTASGTENLRLSHNYFNAARIEDCGNSFVTANVFDACERRSVTGWSDYNAYAGTVPAGEKHSFKAKALPGEKGRFRNAWLFDGRAIDGMPVGPYRRQTRNVKFEVTAPRFTSLSPNTAVAVVEADIPFGGSLFWGEKGNCSNKVALAGAARKHTVSLTGLQPGKSYAAFCQARAEIRSCFSNADLEGVRPVSMVKTQTSSFTAPAKFAQAKEYFAAPSGSDDNPGTKEAPFATAGYAVSRLLPGDTLTLRGGNYAETVDVCVSGTPERPITIRGAEGEKVIFNGGVGCVLAEGFRIANQKNLVFENLLIIGSGLTESFGYSKGPVRINDSEGITFRRVLIGGATWTIHMVNCSGITIEDSVLGYGHGGLEVFSSGATVRHCTFVCGGVSHIVFRNGNRAKACLEDNIFIDLLNMKGGNPIVLIHDPDVFTEKNNCFFVRMPWPERRVYGWNLQNGQPAEKNVAEARKFPFLGRRQVPYSVFVKEFKRESTSFAADPKIKLIPGFLVTYSSYDQWSKNWRKNQTRSFQEYWRLKERDRLEFSNYLPRDPEVLRRGCGPRVEK